MRICLVALLALSGVMSIRAEYTYIKGRGRNVDPKRVFSVTNGVIRVTGEEWGALVTEDEFSDYRLDVDYRFTVLISKGGSGRGRRNSVTGITRTSVSSMPARSLRHCESKGRGFDRKWNFLT